LSGVATLLTPTAVQATVPPALLALTLRAAVAFAAGGAASAKVLTLAQTALLGGWGTKLFALAALLAVGAVACALAVGTFPGAPRGDPAPPEDRREAADARGDPPAVAAPRPPQVDAPAGDAGRPATDLYGDPLPAGAVARLGTSRLRAVTFALSPDGKTLAWIAGDPSLTFSRGEVHLWDVATGRELHRWSHPGALSASFSPDGKVLATGGGSHLRLWDLATGRELAGSGTDGWYSARLSFSPDGKTVFGTTSSGPGGGLIHRHDVATGKALPAVLLDRRPFVGPSAFAPDGKTVAVTEGHSPNDLSPVCLYDTATGKELRRVERKGKPDFEVPLGFSPDGRTVTWLEDGSTHVLAATDTGKELARIPGGRGPCLFSPDGKWVATRRESDSAVWLWEASGGKPLRKVSEPGKCRPVGFSADGKSLVGAASGEVRLWDVETGKDRVRHVFGGHAVTLRCLAFSPDGKLLATGGEDVRLWDKATGKERWRAEVRSYWDHMIAFSPDGVTLAAVDEGMTLLLLEAATGKEVRRIKISDRTDLAAVAFAPDGKSVAVADLQGGISIWSSATGELLRRFRGGGFQLAFSSDGKTLASAGAHEGNVVVSDVATGKEVRRFLDPDYRGAASADLYIPYFVALSPDGATAALGSGPTVRFWDVATGKLIGRVRADLVGGPAVFSPDGKFLALAGESKDREDREVRLVEVATGRECGRFPGHEGAVTCLAFAADGRGLASGSRDCTVLVWRVNPTSP
jgi:WD40 repeat protein